MWCSSAVIKLEDGLKIVGMETGIDYQSESKPAQDGFDDRKSGKRRKLEENNVRESLSRVAVHEEFPLNIAICDQEVKEMYLWP